MPEIQRENILASRLEEMQKFKDSQQLDMMFKMAGMGGDEGDDDEPSSRKRRGLKPFQMPLIHCTVYMMLQCD